ncbi:MAG: hypothetical protein VKJ46_15470 [Leptolyngbyaceae bacterium]|nr:hypothetical protein [Leptolyngbyaceae bacterium]
MNGNGNLGFILKVLLASTGIAIAIKFLGPSLEIAPTTGNVLIALGTPIIVISIALGWRAWQQH